MLVPHENDRQLQSLRDDLFARLAALNDLYHPVYPAPAQRIAELERQIDSLRAAIAARRRDLIPAKA